MTYNATIFSSCLLYQDEALTAINKPVGIAVVGDRHETDLMQIARVHSLHLTNVHRIDKCVSGLTLFARTKTAHSCLSRQLTERSVAKYYAAIVEGDALPDDGIISLPLTTGRKNRVRVAGQRGDIQQSDNHWFLDSGAVFQDKDVYHASTSFSVIARFHGRALLLVSPMTGRRHQIRVHLAWIGSRIIGGPLFHANAERTCLHSLGMTFSHPVSLRQFSLTAWPETSFWTTGLKASPDEQTRLQRQLSTSLEQMGTQ